MCSRPGIQGSFQLREAENCRRIYYEPFCKCGIISKTPVNDNNIPEILVRIVVAELANTNRRA